MSKPRWSKKDQAQFLKRLGELISKGYTLSQGIEFLQIHESEKHKRDLKICLGKLKDGELFHEALEKLNFKRDILMYLYFANQHGNLNDALLEASNMITKQIQYQERLFKILRYPLFLICIVSIMAYMIQTALLPQFNTLLSTMSYDDIFLSSILANIISTGKLVLYVGMFLLGLLLIFYFFYFRRLSPLNKLRKLSKIPFIKTFVVLLTSHYFSIQLSSLLKGGLSIFQAIQVFENSPYMRFLKEEATEIKKQLAQGDTLESIIHSRVYFESELAVVIYHGQTNGEIVKELYDYSQYAIQRLENKMNKILAVIQPLLFTSIGLIVITMYLAMLLPMFKMISTI